MNAMRTELDYLERDEDRHGNPRIYVRRNGKRIRIREIEGTPAFARAYADAVEKLDGKDPARVKALPTHAKGTLGWLGAQYFVSKGDDEFLSLDKDSQRARRNNLEACFKVPLSDDDKDPMGDCPLKYFSAQKAKRSHPLNYSGSGGHLDAVRCLGPDRGFCRLKRKRNAYFTRLSLTSVAKARACTHEIETQRMRAHT
ncbi:hypothetical protein [Bradyrhizobium lablabi]|uniref:hypothetical protein n=1 Tax=Bradyrhizobium lablabi TaxID=722472 RepID=UPI001BAA3E13|nr:hypothetical protein [Bradyrhizobium lablabi]MBR0696746.1 hypothetical protein [Bradyrhizobium lablabi]